MTTNLQAHDQFPDIELPNHQNELTRLSQFTRPSLLDTHLGFLDGYVRGVRYLDNEDDDVYAYLLSRPTSTA